MLSVQVMRALLVVSMLLVAASPASANNCDMPTIEREWLIGVAADGTYVTARVSWTPLTPKTAVFTIVPPNGKGTTVAFKEPAGRELNPALWAPAEWLRELRDTWAMPAEDVVSTTMRVTVTGATPPVDPKGSLPKAYLPALVKALGLFPAFEVQGAKLTLDWLAESELDEYFGVGLLVTPLATVPIYDIRADHYTADDKAEMRLFVHPLTRLLFLHVALNHDAECGDEVDDLRVIDPTELVAHATLGAATPDGDVAALGRAVAAQPGSLYWRVKLLGALIEAGADWPTAEHALATPLPKGTLWGRSFAEKVQNADVVAWEGPARERWAKKLAKAR